MTPEERQIIATARSLIADPRCWTQDVYARDEDGNSVPANHDDACRWCGLGAIIKSASDLGAPVGAGAGATNVLSRIAAASTVVNINDLQGHTAVLALFDKALAQEVA